MARSRPQRIDVKSRVKDLERWADLADLVLIIAREIQFAATAMSGQCL